MAELLRALGTARALVLETARMKLAPIVPIVLLALTACANKGPGAKVEERLPGQDVSLPPPPQPSRPAGTSDEPDVAIAQPVAPPERPIGVPDRAGGFYQDDGPGDDPPANLDAVADAQPRAEAPHPYANRPYTVFGKTYTPYAEYTPYKARGVASWYGRKFHGKRTSSGETYDMYAMTAAHPILPIPSYAKVTHLASGKSVVVKVNDRGPFHSDRIIDLSFAAAHRLGFANAGSAQVEVIAIDGGTALAATTPRTEPQPAAPAPTSVAAAPVATPTAPAAPAPAAKPAAATKPAAAAKTTGGFFLQLGAFSVRENAEVFRDKVASQLTWLNEALGVVLVDGLFKVHAGPYAERAEAQRAGDRMRSGLGLSPLIVRK
jgi:rare lipoprotein A